MTEVSGCNILRHRAWRLRSHVSGKKLGTWEREVPWLEGIHVLWRQILVLWDASLHLRLTRCAPGSGACRKRDVQINS